ncbi:hypothetical protein CBS101457_000021 [Exobasidium rhododendri]|nr:hypothetical protein CBS101457_000021 [Exobasidium rhododendri]
MMVDRQDVGPTSLITSAGYGGDSDNEIDGIVASSSNSQTHAPALQHAPPLSTYVADVVDDSDSDTNLQNGRGLSGLESSINLSQHDPLAERLQYNHSSWLDNEEDIGDEDDQMEASRSPSVTRVSTKRKTSGRTPRKDMSAQEMMSNTVHQAMDGTYKHQAEVEREITKRRELELDFERKKIELAQEERRIEREDLARERQNMMQVLFDLARGAQQQHFSAPNP